MTTLHPFRLLILFSGHVPGLGIVLARPLRMRSGFFRGRPSAFDWPKVRPCLTCRIALAGESDKTGFGDVRSRKRVCGSCHSIHLTIIRFRKAVHWAWSSVWIIASGPVVEGLSVGRDASAGAFGFSVGYPALSSPLVNRATPPLFYFIEYVRPYGLSICFSAYLGIRAEYQLTLRCAVSCWAYPGSPLISNGEQFQYQVRKEWRPGVVAGRSPNRLVAGLAEGRLFQQ